MKKYQFYEPNFKNCNLNISATLAEFLGAENKNATLLGLKRELAKGYKNVVFICFDGLGINPININLEKTAILRKNIVKTLVSTFPSTTTNATTSLLTNKLPLEHGWLGWNLHFEEIGRNLDLYNKKDSATGEVVNYKMPIGDNTDFFFEKGNGEYEINMVVMPYYSSKHPEYMHKVTNEFELCEEIKKITGKKGKQFVYAYMDEPDAIMHFCGVSSKEAKQKIESINNEVEKLFIESEDTLFIITADHGQIDITGYIEFYKDKELNDMLVCEPYLDARAPAFRVKPGLKPDFERRFTEKYGDDFVLFKSQDLIEKGYFGERGDKGYLLGDYIAIGTNTNKQFLWNETKTRYLGHHTSLTEEMLVPLILLKKK